MAKRVLVLVRHHPRTERGAEALRMAVGLFLADHQVTVALLDDGVHAALAGADRGEAAQHVEILPELGYPIWVEAESLGSGGPPVPGATVVPRREIDAAMLEFDAVVPF